MAAKAAARCAACSSATFFTVVVDVGVEGNESLDTELDRDTVTLGATDCDAKEVAGAGLGEGVNMLPMLAVRGRLASGTVALVGPATARVGVKVGDGEGVSVGVGWGAVGTMSEAR